MIPAFVGHVGLLYDWGSEQQVLFCTIRIEVLFGRVSVPTLLQGYKCTVVVVVASS